MKKQFLFVALAIQGLFAVSAQANLPLQGESDKTSSKQSVAIVDRQVDTNAADSSKVYDIDEVVVVSQPKEAFKLRLQPLSSSSFSQSDLTSLQVQDLHALSGYVPSLTMPDYGSRYTPSVYIRGIGSRVNSPAVGIYVDGMPLLSKSAFAFHTYGIDRVDVLRGAQGTLYGMNTEGGMIRLYTKNPMSYQGTEVNLSVGTHLWRKAEVAHYNKVSDKFAFAVAGFYDGQDGFFKNQFNGEKADKLNEGGGRLRLLWQPTDRLTFDFITDGQLVRQYGYPYGIMEGQDGSFTTQDPNTNHTGNYRRGIFNTALSIGYKGKGFDLSSVTSWQYLKDYMLMDIDYQPDDFMHMEQRQLQNGVTEELAVKGITGIWHWTAGAFFSTQWLKTNAPVYFDPMMNAFLSKTITDYAYYGMLNSMAARMAQGGMPQAVAEAQAAANIERAGGCNIDMAVSTIPGLFRTPQSNLGIFHESVLELTPRLSVTLGLRYDYSHVGIDYETSALATLAEDVMGVHVDAAVRSELAHHEDDDFSQLLPKAGISYQFDDSGSNFYAMVAKGYRAGGYNIQMFSDILQTELQDNAQKARGEMTLEHDDVAYANIAETIAFKPETSLNYEFGTHLNLFSNGLHLDLSGFYMQVRNQQLSVMAGNFGFGRMMVNAGKSYSCGVEASLRGSAFDNHLDYSLNYGYTRAVFKNYDDSIKVDGKLQYVSYKDKRVPFVPEHTIGAAVNVNVDINGKALKTLTVGANVNAQGKTYWDEANTYWQKLYATVGAHADLNCQLGSLNCVLSLWGRNLTNSNYNTFAVQSAATGKTLTFGQLGNPIQVGVDLRLKW